MKLKHPRQWGACWLALELWDQLELDHFWEPRLPEGRKGTNWLHVFKTLVCYRWIDPGSEWRLHRDWFKNSAMTDLLPGVREALAELSRRDYRMSVASNKPARFGRRILEELGLERLFDVVHGPDSVGRPKPDPAMLRACLQSMNRPAGDSVYVGDMPLDVESACNADVPVVLVAGGSSSRKELLATGEAVISTFRELPLLLSPR